MRRRLLNQNQVSVDRQRNQQQNRYYPEESVLWISNHLRLETFDLWETYRYPLDAMKYILSLVISERFLLIFALAALAIGSGVNLALPAVVREFINHSPEYYLSEHPLYTAGVLTALFGIQAFAFYYRSLLFNILGQRVINRLRKNLFSTLIQKEIAFFDANRVGDLISRLSADTLLMQDAISVKLSVFIRYSFQVLVGIVMMLMLSLRLTAAIVVVVPVLICFSIYLGKKLKKLSKSQQAALGVSTGIAEETLASARIVKAFNQERRFNQRFADQTDALLSISIARARVASFFSSFVSFLMNMAIVLILLYGATLVFNQTLSVGDLTAFMLYGVIVAVSFAFVGSGYAEFVQALGASERIFEFLGTHTDIRDAKTISHAPSPIPLQKEIAFDHVSFAYPTRSDVPIFDNLSLTIPAGKKVALVGPSGAGKSTLIGLILGFYQPQKGSILIDGKALTPGEISGFRESSALVPQEPQLFALSIAENLRLGKESATLDEMRDACSKARILEFIDSLPNKFETPVGERGVLLSAGQKQRIAIARALLRDPELLILDEATSALDSENEHLVQDALNQLMIDRTVVIIAHRLSTVKNADMVIVLENGTITESGTHTELLNHGGLYRQLVERQELHPS